MKALVAWKEKANRKPLFVTGCRQCGKTWLMTEFGNRYFEKTLIFNFEKEPAIADISKYNLDPVRILRELGMLRGGKTNRPGTYTDRFRRDPTVCGSCHLDQIF